MHPTVVYLLIAAGVLYAMLRARRSYWTIQIDYVPHQPPKIRGVASSRTQQITRFLEHDLRLEDPITILATKERSGRLRTRIQGKLDAGTRQRIRNFLIEML